MKVCVKPNCLEEMNLHAEEAFPEECCGFMLGTEAEDESREISEVYKIINTKEENRERRYLIEPTEQLKAERHARENQLDVLGVYHSHPHHRRNRFKCRFNVVRDYSGESCFSRAGGPPQNHRRQLSTLD